MPRLSRRNLNDGEPLKGRYDLISVALRCQSKHIRSFGVIRPFGSAHIYPGRLRASKLASFVRISRPQVVVQLSWLQRPKLVQTQTSDFSADGIGTQARICNAGELHPGIA